MDELVLYVTAGDPADKHAQESLAAVSSIQKSQHYTTFRNAESPLNGAAITGFGAGERLFVAGIDKALITSYAWGKETADQRFPVPEQMLCLAIAHHPNPGENGSQKGENVTRPQYRVPWLLAAGSRSGKLYIWELALGDLVCVKDAHYQAISTMEFSPCGTFLVTGGADTRVNVWRTLDLVTPESLSTCKAHASFTDHALAVTGVSFAASPVLGDCRVILSSKDGTLRVYDVLTRLLLTTFVFSAGVECFARDPAGRAYYAGLADGTVRQVALYAVNKYTHVLEAIGGGGKIVTVEADPNMEATFLHHQSGSGCVPTAMRVTMDGMSLVSGDSQGRTFVADIVTRQVVKLYTACKLAIAYIYTGVCSSELLSATTLEKKHRLLPPLKRVLTSGNLMEHTLTMQLSSAPEKSEDFSTWLDRKAQEGFAFKKDGTQVTTSAGEKVLQEKLDKVSAAYTSLKDMYDQLVQAQEMEE
ncbi:hypothetical protein HF325_005815 [Metschnikowia pulcherrima]|uniref:Pre-rRNA-processing protein IPI3 n=1 Tax=Metschnikowia pulcherrima TaxID=27326 RepID=A0A8H7L7W4_9ASCO|nr:hypothetical protein HF325_005815 [Metschnikowia pulcherrima]